MKNVVISVIFILLIASFTSFVYAQGEKREKEVAYEAILAAKDHMSKMQAAGFSIKRVNDTVIEAIVLYEGQVALEEKTGSADYSKVIETANSVAEIRKEAFKVYDELNALSKRLEELSKSQDMTEAIEIFNEAKREFEDERYEQTREAIDTCYKKINELQATFTRIKAIYEASTKTLAGFFARNYKTLTIIALILLIIYFFFGEKIMCYFLNRAIRKLEIEKQTLSNLIKKAQYEYFQKGAISEATYRIRISKFSELIRDINRRIPLLRVKIEELQKRKRRRAELIKKQLHKIGLYKTEEERQKALKLKQEKKRLKKEEEARKKAEKAKVREEKKRARQIEKRKRLLESKREKQKKEEEKKLRRDDKIRRKELLMQRAEKLRRAKLRKKERERAEKKREKERRKEERGKEKELAKKRKEEEKRREKEGRIRKKEEKRREKERRKEEEERRKKEELKREKKLPKEEKARKKEEERKRKEELEREKKLPKEERIRRKKEKKARKRAIAAAKIKKKILTFLHSIGLAKTEHEKAAIREAKRKKELRKQLKKQKKLVAKARAEKLKAIEKQRALKHKEKEKPRKEKIEEKEKAEKARLWEEKLREKEAKKKEEEAREKAEKAKRKELEGQEKARAKAKKKKEKEERKRLKKLGYGKIKNYVQKTKSIGFSDEQIKAKLEERGWPAELIKKAFDELG